MDYGTKYGRDRPSISLKMKKIIKEDV